MTISIYDVLDAMQREDFVMVIDDRKVGLIDKDGNSVKLGSIVTVVNTKEE